MECTCVTTCEADKLLWLEHLSNSYVIKTPDYFIILSHLCIYIIWSLAKLVAPSRNICLLRMCFYCTYNILCMNPIEGLLSYELRRRQSGALPRKCTSLRRIHTLSMDTRADRGFPALCQKVQLLGN